MTNTTCALALTLTFAALGLRAGEISTIAGTGTPGFSGDGGAAKAAQLDAPRSIALHPATGDLYITDYSNNRIRRLTPDGIVSTVAGNGEIGLVQEGSSLATPFIALYGVSWAPKIEGGRLLIASGDGLHEIEAGGGALRVVVADRAVPVADATSGTLYVSDFYRIVRREASGEFTTIAGSDGAEFGDTGDGGPAAQARMTAASSLAVDRLGRIWLADVATHRVRRFLPGGNMESVAGTGTAGFGGDGGPGARAALNEPRGIAVDVAGNLYIADGYNLRVRRVRASDGVIETFAGTGKEETAGDGGDALNASFASLSHVAVSCTGVFVSDGWAQIRMIRLTDPLLALRPIADMETGAAFIRPAKTFTIEGCHLAESSARAEPDRPLPVKLGGAEVLVNGVPTGLVSVGSTRLEVQLPVGTAAGLATVRVNVGSKTAGEVAAEIR